MSQQKTKKLHGKDSYTHCPYCGSKLESEQFKVGTYKTNTRVICPEHGILVD